MRLALTAFAATLCLAPPPALAGPSKPRPKAAAGAPAATPSPRNEPVYQMTLPAKISFIAWLPVDKAPELVDLDVRIEIVVPMSCGDRVGGVMRVGGPKLDGPDTWEVVMEHRPALDCTPNPTRISNRYALRMRVPDGQTRDLTIGATTLRVARKGKAVTVDGVPPEGDVPGAPPTARPFTLVAGEPTAASLVSAARDSGDPDAARTVFSVTARYPACAGAPLGMLARGDGSTRFSLSRFVPVASAPLDAPCTGKPVTRTSEISTAVRIPKKSDKAQITVGSTSLTVNAGPRPHVTPTPPPSTPPAGPSSSMSTSGSTANPR